MWSALPFINQGRLLTEEANMLPKKKSCAADSSERGFSVGVVVLLGRAVFSPAGIAQGCSSTVQIKPA